MLVLTIHVLPVEIARLPKQKQFMTFRITFFFLLVFLQPNRSWAQLDLEKPFRDCHLQGSITLYDTQQKKWLYSDQADSQLETLPASTFKIINSLIALETGVIRDENEIVKWVGKTDTVLYGYRPEIYHDMPMKEAFRESAGWVYIELAKKIGKERYRQ
jgi:beta-lactamase class D